MNSGDNAGLGAADKSHGQVGSGTLKRQNNRVLGEEQGRTETEGTEVLSQYVGASTGCESEATTGQVLPRGSKGWSLGRRSTGVARVLPSRRWSRTGSENKER